MTGMTAKMMMAAGLGGAVAFLTMAAAPRERTRAAPPTPAAAPAPPDQRAAALDGIKPGLWVVTREGEGGAPARLCIEDAARLVQLAHGAADCRRMTIADGPAGATIQYRCGADGWGRTAIKVENAETVRIDTQGILANAPFAWRATARRAGDCPA